MQKVVKMNANPALLNILKSLVDKQVPDLKRQVQSAANAQEKINTIKDQITIAEQYANTNYFDRDATQESAEEIRHYEQEMADLNPLVANGQTAKQQLLAAKNFYVLYEDCVVKPARHHAHTMKINYEISKLQSEYTVAQKAEIDAECMLDSQRRYIEDIQAEPESPEYAVLSQYYEIYMQKKRITEQIIFKLKQLQQ